MEEELRCTLGCIIVEYLFLSKSQVSEVLKRLLKRVSLIIPSKRNQGHDHIGSQRW